MGAKIPHTGVALYHDNIGKHIFAFEEPEITESNRNRIMFGGLLRESNWSPNMVSLRTHVWLGG